MFNIQTIVLTDATDSVVGIVLRQTGFLIICRSVAVAAAPVGVVAPSKSCCNIFAVREANTHGAFCATHRRRSLHVTNSTSGSSVEIFIDVFTERSQSLELGLTPTGHLCHSQASLSARQNRQEQQQQGRSNILAVREGDHWRQV